MQHLPPDQRHPGSDEKFDEAAPKLGSAQPGNDRFDAVGMNAPPGIPVERIAADVVTRAIIPVEGIPIEPRPLLRFEAETRPADVRPVEIRPREAL